MQVSFNKQAGLLLLEVLAGLIILASVITGIAMMINRSSEDTQAAIAAQHLRTVGDAASAYIRNNLPSILQRANADTPVLIKVSDLQLAKNLPDNFSSTNAYQQQTCVLVLQPDPIGKPGQVTAMVVTEGGKALDIATVNTVANLVGASGGAIRNNDGNFHGSRNSWTVAISNFDKDNIHIPSDPSLPDEPSQNCSGTSTPINKPSLSAGHPAMALWLANGGINPDVIYRTAIPGRPDLNKMETPLGLPIVMENQPCVDKNGVTLDAGTIARSDNGNLLTCQNGKWEKPFGKSNLVLRKSQSKGGGNKYANCDTDNGEKFVIGTCTRWCSVSGSVAGGKPHIVTNSEGKSYAKGWICGRYAGFCSKPTAFASCALTSSGDANPFYEDGGTESKPGILVSTSDDDPLPPCEFSGGKTKYTCEYCNDADACNTCNQGDLELSCKGIAE